MKNSLPNAIVLFDGVCNFCNNSVQFILKRDKTAYFHFASLQSDIGQQLLREYGLLETADKIDSVVLIENGKAYTHSTAALRIARKLTWCWKMLYGIILVPPFLRNAVYRWIARNRYRWFGKRDACMIPEPQWRSRFL